MLLIREEWKVFQFQFNCILIVGLPFEERKESHFSCILFLDTMSMDCKVTLILSKVEPDIFLSSPHKIRKNVFKFATDFSYFPNIS